MSQGLLQQAIALAPKVRAVTDEVLASHIQRGDIVEATWLALVSGRPVFFLGTPGVDKTGTIKDMVRRMGASFYEELMPMLASGAQLIVESTALKEAVEPDGSKIISTVDRIGRAAGVKLFFGDEVWKTEDGVLKVLFDLFNLDDIRHEGQVYQNLLWTFLCASNEIPDPDSKMSALWSRMTIRVQVHSLNRGGKKALVSSRLSRYQNAAAGKTTPMAQLTATDIETMRKARPFVEIPDQIVETVLNILEELRDDTTSDFKWAWEDDRRFGRIFDILQAHALLAGRTTVNKSDLTVLEWLLWDTSEQIAVVRAKIAPYCRTPLTEAQELVDSLLAPGGTVQLVLAGNRAKGVEALTQCESTENELKRLKGEANGSDSAMATQIGNLIVQVNSVKEDIIAVVTTGRPRTTGT